LTKGRFLPGLVASNDILGRIKRSVQLVNLVLLKDIPYELATDHFRPLCD
jgi:hypothetical protein